MKSKIPLVKATAIANELITALQPYCERIEIAGSIRREKEYVGDIELLCIPKKQQRITNLQTSLFDDPNDTMNDLGLMKTIRQFEIIRGDLDKKDAKYISFVGPEEIQVDLFTANEQNYGYIKILRTGSYEYNTRYFMPKLKRAGYVLNDGYISLRGQLIAVPEEIDVYRMFGAEQIDLPEKRSEIGEQVNRINYR